MSNLPTITVAPSDTPASMATKVANYLVAYYQIDPKHVLVLKPRSGGTLDGSRSDMTLRSHGWYHNDNKGAQVVSEDAEYDWTIRMADKLNSLFEAEQKRAGNRSRLFAECATGFALSITTWD
jgi:hypothetical protein